MIDLPSGTKIWLVAGITNMRNGFNGLGSMFAMNDNLPDDIALLKQRLGEQDARGLVLEAKLDAASARSTTCRRSWISCGA